MAFFHHTIRSSDGSRKKVKRVGRGLGSGHGTTATRGTKGQRARSGGSKGLKLKGMKQMLLRIPKVRGFKSIHAKQVIVNVALLEETFHDGAVVSPSTLVSQGVLKNTTRLSGEVKILGTGELTKKLTVEQCRVSQSARAKIEKVGGTVRENV